MLELGICPKCGSSSRRWSSGDGYFPCGECNFWITPNEIEKVIYESNYLSEKARRRILNKRLKWKRKKQK